MKRKTIMYIIGVSISYIFMLVWGCLIVDYFPNKSVVSLIGSIVIEVIAFIVMIVFCIKIRKIRRQNEPPRVPMTKQEKIMGIRSIFLLVSAFILTYPTLFIGNGIAKSINPSYKVYFIWIFAICCISPIILTLVNLLLKKNYINRINKKNVEELQHYFFSHRDFAEKTSSKKFIFLKRWSRLIDLYSALFGIFAIGIAISVGVIDNADIAITFYFLSYVLLCCSFSSFRFPIHKSVFEEEKTYITEDEYPELYEIAKQAANTLQCKGEIQINVLANCNACIAKLGNIYSVRLCKLNMKK